MVFPNSKAGCSRVPPQSATLTNKYCYPSDPVRLACLIHATSVRSEPESNSQKKNFESLLLEALAGFRAPHKLPVCVPPPFRWIRSGSSLRSAFFSTISCQKIDSRPAGPAPLGVANEDIVYQKARGRARGKPKFFEKSFRRPSARRGDARPGRARIRRCGALFLPIEATL